MKKSKKLLRKLLAAYRNELADKSYTDECSRLVDICTVLMEEIENARR